MKIFKTDLDIVVFQLIEESGKFREMFKHKLMSKTEVMAASISNRTYLMPVSTNSIFPTITNNADKAYDLFKMEIYYESNKGIL